MIGGGDTVSVPPAGAAEVAGREAQTNLINIIADAAGAQLRFSESIQPVLLQQAGIVPGDDFTTIANPRFAQLQSQLASLQQRLGETPQSITTAGTETFIGGGEGGFFGGTPAVSSPNPAFAQLQSQIASINAELARTSPTTTTGQEFQLDPQVAAIQQQQRDVAGQSLDVIGQTLDQVEQFLLQNSGDLSELFAQRIEFETEALDRVIAGLQGDLPLPENLIEERKQQKATVEEFLRKEFGTGFRTTTGALNVLADFDRETEVLFDQARRGQLTTLAGIAGQGFQETQGTLSSLLANAGLASAGPALIGGGVTTPGQVIGGAAGVSQLDSSAINALLGASQAQQGPLNQLFAERQLATQAAIANAQQNSPLATAAGQLGGLALGGLLSNPALPLF